MRRGAAARRWRWTAAAAAAVLVMAAGLPAHSAEAITQAEDIDTPAGEPQPTSDPLSTGQRPFGLAVSTALSGSCTTRLVPTNTVGIQIPFSNCDTLSIADPVNHLVRAIDTGEGFEERVLAGNGGKGTEGDEGSALAAQLSGPYAAYPDPGSGQLYIADTFANQVRRVDRAGTIHRLAGVQSGAFGFSGEGVDAATAGLESPFGIVRGFGVTYVADTLDNRVREIRDPDCPTCPAIIRTVVGTGAAGYSGDGGQGVNALLNRPRGLAVDLDGILYIADTGNNVVRQWIPDTGVISTVAGTGSAGFAGDGKAATAAQLREPSGVAISRTDGTLYVADTDNNRIRKVDAFGTITTVAGTGVSGSGGDGGPATSAQLNSPFAVTFLRTGALVIGDTGNNRVRVVEGPTDPTPGVIATLAGNGAPSHSTGEGGALDQLARPTAVGTSGSLGSLAGQLCDTSAATIVLVLDTFNHRLGAQCPAPAFGAVADVIGDGLPGGSPATGPLTAPGPTPNRLSYPMGLAVSRSGTQVYIADTFNDVVRVIDTSAVVPTLRTVAGTGTAGFSGDGQPATQAQLNHPGGLAVDRDGNLYIADTYNDRIRKVDASGKITTIAGTGVSGSGGDGGPATAATLFFPEGVAVDTASPADVYVADTFSHRIRRIDGTTGTIAAFAGTGQEGFANGAATTAAQFDRPWAVSVDATPGPVGPVVYVADQLNHRVRFVAGGTVSTLTVAAGSRGFLHDRGPVGMAEVDGPRGVTALDSAGTLLVADSFNDRVRRVGLGQLQVTVANNGLFNGARTGTTSPALIATVTNVGPGFVNVTGVTATPPFHAPFFSCAGLAPGATCSGSVTFQPTTTGLQKGTVTATGDAGTPAMASLSGTGLQPALTLIDTSGNTLPEPPAPPVVITASLVVKLTNSGTWPLDATVKAPIGGTPACGSTGSCFTVVKPAAGPSVPPACGPTGVPLPVHLEVGASCAIEIDSSCLFAGAVDDQIPIQTDAAPVGQTVTRNIAVRVPACPVPR